MSPSAKRGTRKRLIALKPLSDCPSNLFLRISSDFIRRAQHAAAPTLLKAAFKKELSQAECRSFRKSFLHIYSTLYPGFGTLYPTLFPCFCHTRTIHPGLSNRSSQPHLVFILQPVTALQTCCCNLLLRLCRLINRSEKGINDCRVKLTARTTLQLFFSLCSAEWLFVRSFFCHGIIAGND